MKKLSVDVWSDIACPWCYVGKRRFERALRSFEHAKDIALRWRSFELDPGAPPVRPGDVSYAERLGKKYGGGVREGQAMIDRMVGIAKNEGLEMRFELNRGGNTFDAHRLLHYAYERGAQDKMKERLFRAYFCEGEPIGDRDALARLAEGEGLDAAEVKVVLSGNAFSKAVRADEHEAAEHGISGVPFFVIGRYGVSGAQPSDQLLRVLERAWSEAPEFETQPDGEVCGPDGC